MFTPSPTNKQNLIIVPMPRRSDITHHASCHIYSLAPRVTFGDKWMSTEVSLCLQEWRIQISPFPYSPTLTHCKIEMERIMPKTYRVSSLISPEVCINNIATLFPHCHPAINLPFATQFANLGVLGVDLADAQSNPWQVSWVEVGEGLHRSSPPFHVRFWEVCVGSRGTLSVDDTARHSLVI